MADKVLYFVSVSPPEADPNHQATTSTPATTTLTTSAPTPFTCNFENGNTCSWMDDVTTDNSDFAVTTGSNSTNGPSVDHTHHNRDSFYAALTANGKEPQKVGRLNSPEVVFSSENCVKFWYYRFGENLGNVSMLIKLEGSDVLSKHWGLSQESHDDWNVAHVQIEENSNFMVVLEANTFENATGSIAFDDIDILAGKCPSHSDHCDFDGNMCNYENDHVQDQLDWFLHQANENDPQFLPLGRETYIYVQEGQENETAILTSPVLESTSSYHCLEFWLHFEGVLGNLDVTMTNHLDGFDQTLKVKSYQNDLGPDWKRQTVSLVADSDKISLGFEMTLSAIYGVDSVVALDGIYYHDTSCSYLGDCSFEKGESCNWMPAPGYDFEWLLGSGGGDSGGWLGPDVDHTFGNASGGYAFVDVSKVEEGKKAAMMVEVNEEDDTDRCVQFWMHNFGQNVGVLRALVEEDLVWMFEVASDNESDWYQGAFSYKETMTHLVKLEFTVGPATSGDFAIDDISFSTSHCESIPPNSGNTTLAPSSTLPTTASTTTQDPENPYNCQFNHGTYCHWIQRADDGADFSIKTLTETGNSLAVANVGSFEGDSPFAWLQSPLVSASNKMCFVFKYQNMAAAPGKLSLYKLSEDNVTKLLVFSADDVMNELTSVNVNVASKTNFYLLLEASKISITEPDAKIFLDDLELRDWDSCPPSRFECDFEVDSCGFYQGDGDDGNWLRAKGSDATHGPEMDHSTSSSEGHYMYVDGRNGSLEENNQFVLFSPFFTTSFRHCVRLCTNLHGSEAKMLRIFGTTHDNEEVEIYSHGGPNEAWNTVEFEAPFDPHFALKFIANFGQKGDSYIAIDDVFLADEYCYKPGDCDFTLGKFCSWFNVNDGSDEADWSTSSVGATFDVEGASHGNRAALQSMEFMPSQARCIKFGFDLRGEVQGFLNVSVKTVDESIVIWSLGGNVGERIEGQASFSSPNQPYTLLFEGIVGDNHIDPIIISHVSFEDQSCQLIPSDAIPNDNATAAPTVTTVLPTTTVSFEDPGSCNFEEGLCQWTNEVSESYNWTWVNASRPYAQPGFDHTFGDESGHYVTVIRSSASNESQTFILNGPTWNRKKCFYFWYHMEGSKVGSLELNKIEEQVTDRPLFHRAGDQGPRWIEVKETIPIETRNCHLQFMATVDQDFDGDISIDDVRVTDGDCPSDNVPYELCSFDSKSLCGYKAKADGAYVWTAEEGVTEQDNDMTIWLDHTLEVPVGIFLQADIGMAESGQKTTLTSPVYDSLPIDVACVQFYYQFLASSGGAGSKFGLYLAPELEEEHVIWENFVYGGGHVWRKAEAEIDTRHRFQLRFEATAGDLKEVKIGLDDVKVQLNKCELKHCNFELDSCTYYNDRADDDIDWVRKAAKDGESGYGPPVDHTTGTSDGYYMMVHAESVLPQSRSIRARLLASALPPTVGKDCISFWFYMLGNQTGTLSVAVAQGDNTRATTIWQLSDSSEERWIQGMASLDRPDAAFRLYFETEMKPDADGFIAIDDAEILPEACGVTPPSANPAETSVQRLSCSFEDDTCQFVQAQDDERDFIIASGSSGNDTSAPDNSFQGNFLLLNETGYAEIISPLASPNAPDGYCLKFSFMAFGTSEAQVIVGIRDMLTWNETERFFEAFQFLGNTRDDWEIVEIPIAPRPYDFTLSMRAFVSDTFGDVAFGDVTLHRDQCHRSTICHFESNLCGWTSDSIYPIPWVLERAGDAPYEEDNVLIDHTYNTVEGHVALANLTYGYEGAMGRLKKDFEADFGTHCLSFFFFDITDQTGTLKVVKGVGEEEVTLWSHSRTYFYRTWRYATVEISEDLPFYVRIAGLL